MNNNYDKILITGGAGYIGSVLSILLLNHGFNVRVIDNLSFGDKAIRSMHNYPNFEFINGDICIADDLNKALDNIDCLIHLAAIVGDPVCQKFPELAVRVNKGGSELLYETAVKKKVPRFIFSSTCSNYGKMPDPDGFVDEHAPLNPVSHYAELKVGFENFLLDNKSEITKPVILRFSTAYGLSERMRFDLTVNEFTRDLFLNKPLDIYGEQFWRPYCHTTDLAYAVLKAVEATDDKVGYEAFNVGDNNENYQKKTLIEMILKQLPDKKEKVSFVTKDEDPRDYRVNFDKIKKRLGFELTKTVPDGIAEIIEAIKSNRIKDPYDECYKNM